jgi:hypothetical protein
VAAAVAVLAVIGASVALPRLLTGPAGQPGIGASALAHDPPFQVIVTRPATGGTSLPVRTPAGQVNSTLAPPRGHRMGLRHRHREPAEVHRGHLT